MSETYVQGTPTETIRIRNDLVRTVREVHIAKESIEEIADAVVEKLKLPSAQPEITQSYRKEGHWIATHERGLLSNPDSITYVCSECGHKIYTVYGIPTLTRYCQDCGARMYEQPE